MVNVGQTILLIPRLCRSELNVSAIERFSRAGEDVRPPAGQSRFGGGAKNVLRWLSRKFGRFRPSQESAWSELMKTKVAMDRRTFLKASSVFACGLTGAATFLPPVIAGAEAARSTAARGPNIIGPREPYSPHLGTLVSMLNWMRGAILEPVQGLTVAQLDYLHDAKANTIGAMLLHLAAVERLYQIHTFEGKKWGDLDDKTKKQWDAPALLGEGARKSIKGNNLAYYLDKLKEVREHTLAELQKRDDTWLMQVDPDWMWGPTNNYCKWFHVCEHESNHNGQIKWIKGRLPA